MFVWVGYASPDTKSIASNERCFLWPEWIRLCTHSMGMNWWCGSLQWENRGRWTMSCIEVPNGGRFPINFGIWPQLLAKGKCRGDVSDLFVTHSCDSFRRKISDSLSSCLHQIAVPVMRDAQLSHGFSSLKSGWRDFWTDLKTGRYIWQGNMGVLFSCGCPI